MRSCDQVVVPDKATIHPSVLVNGSLLQADRKTAGFTQASFCAACDSVSLVTVRRAEQGHRIIKASLQRMATVLGQTVERYLASELLENPNDYVVPVAGQWVSFSVEADHGRLPYVVEETVTLDQNGKHITGVSQTTTPYEQRQLNFDSMRIFKNVIIGTEYARDWEPPLGIGTLIVAASRNDEWLEGFTSWFDVDSDRVETSRIILVREGCRSFTEYCDDVRSIMKREILQFRLRKLVESGYELADAVTMLASISKKY